MKELDYQKIVDVLQEILPPKWKKVIFYAAYTTNGSYVMKYYIDLGDGTYTDCYTLEQFSRSQLVKAFMSIDKLIATVRNDLNEKDKWSVITIMLDENGTFKTNFDYANIDESTIEYQKKWKKKYIG